MNVFRKRIQWKIAFPFMVLLLLSMVTLLWYLTRIVRQSYIDDLQNQMEAQAQLMADVLLPSFQRIEQDFTETDLLAKHWSNLLNIRVTFIDGNGVVIGESDEERTSMDNHANRPEVILASKNGSGSSIRRSDTIYQELLYTAAIVKAEDKVLGFVRIAVPTHEIDSTISRLQRTVIGATLPLFPVVILIAAWLAQNTTRPIRELTQAANKLASGESTQQIIPTTDDEVGTLTRSFNRMNINLSEKIQSLGQESQKLNTILEEMTDGVVIADPTGKIEIINRAGESLFSTTKDGAINHTLAEILRHHQIIELWQKCKDSGETQTLALELPSQRKYLQVIVTYLGSSLPEFTLLVFQDMTKLQRLETVRRDFISNISHELRTPLASLKALTETLLDTALEDPPAARKFLIHIETEVDALSLMVSELLELSRIESGIVPFQFVPISPNEVVKSAVERLSIQAERAGIDLSISLTENLPMVLADPSRLEQVMVNLIHNAIKFTSEDGQIEVEVTTGKSPMSPGDLIFIVRDTGVGIATEDIPRIFERFFKTDRSRTGGGTGLGLAISRHIIEAHGGKIWVESKIGFGSKFYFSLPAAE